MYRALVQKLEADQVLLPDDEVHHLVRVRRAGPGDRFVALDGTGKIYLCSLEKGKGGWFGRILQELEEVRESPLHLTLAQALIKKDKFEWVIQKAAELGVREIVPLATVRTEIRLEERREDTKLKRWHKILVEAVKQCGRAHIPALSAPMTLEEFLSRAKASILIALDENEGEPLRSVLCAKPPLSSCAVLIGPEGGWDDSERDLFQRHGVKRVHLGPRILRTETAATTIVALLQYELGDLGLP